MKFNKLVASILNEQALDPSNIPVLDGEREGYIVQLVDDSLDEGMGMYIERAKRISKGYMWHFWDREGIDSAIDLDEYEGYMYDETVMMVEYVCERIGIPNYLRKKMLAELAKISHIIGTWKVFSRNEEIWAGVEINLDHYEHGGLKDAVISTLDSDQKDISDW